jgi:hypothetical protein
METFKTKEELVDEILVLISKVYQRGSMVGQITWEGLSRMSRKSLDALYLMIWTSIERIKDNG